ncbi:MAG: hypothetical protein GPW18_04465 [Euryarchaeota archaeon]|jgi:apolipoprotein N-acyltransferase|nr:hypothetical protein [Thermoplasmata archaeon]MVT36008.1 hypothetical protein [Euryarchaeota archaeon]
MNKDPVFIIISIILTFSFVIFIPYAWTAIFAAIPLYKLRERNSAIAGFLIGFSTIVLYLFYPTNKLIELSGILGNATGLPGLLLILIYPLIYGIIMMLSSTLFSHLSKK